MKRLFLNAVLLVGCGVAAHAANILVYDENTDSHNAQGALNNLGLAFTLGNLGNFNTLLTGSSWDLVILDIPSSNPDFAPLEAYIAGGGKVLISYYDALDHPDLGTAFQFAFADEFDTPIPVNGWVDHPIFVGTSLPLLFPADIWATDGSRMDPTAGGTALGGFTANPTAGQAAIILGNSGRTLYNGFLWDEFGDASVQGQTFIGNEINFLLAPTDVTTPEPATVSMVGFALLGLGALRLRRRK